jgi:hypothetical protein
MDMRSILFPFVLALALAGCGLDRAVDPPQALEPSSTAGAPSGVLVTVSASLPEHKRPHGRCPSSPLMAYHHIAHDRPGGEPYLVTY